MAGISIISNFDLSSQSPVDYRMVSNTPFDRESIFFKYNGLQTYVLSEDKTYNWSDGTWSLSGKNGIYGGSGSLIGNTIVDLGITGDYVTSSSINLSLVSKTTDNSLISYNNNWNRVSLSTTSANLRYTSGVYSNGSTVSHISMHNTNVSGLISFNNVMELNSVGSFFIKKTQTSFGFIESPNLSQNRVFRLPNKDGRIALKSELPTFGSLNLNTVTIYGNTTSVGMKSYTNYYSTSANLFIGLGSNVRNWITYNNVSGSGMYYLVQTTQSVANLVSHYIRLNSYTASITENYLIYNQYLTGQGQLFLGSLTLSSDRNIYFPNNSGTVSLIEWDLPSGLTAGYSVITKSNNLTNNYVISLATPFDYNHYWPGLTNTSLYMQWDLTNKQPSSFFTAPKRTFELPNPTASIAGGLLIIKNYQGFNSDFSINAGYNSKILETTIPYWYRGATYTVLPNLGSSTMLICDGSRWTRIAFVEGNNSNDPDCP